MMKRNASSFRDPSGFVYTKNSILYRQINHIHKDNYDLMLSSGLYKTLTSAGLMVQHSEVKTEQTAYKTLMPVKIPFLSYPWEWCFSARKDGALLTLEIAKTALAYGMSLKDATSFNVQFFQGRPIFIDSLSFEKYHPGTPWVAYKQFCEQFLAPLVLESYVDARLSSLLLPYVGGVPLDLASRLLPLKSRLNAGILVHIHLHSQHRNKNIRNSMPKSSFSKLSYMGLLDNLTSTVQNLHLKKDTTVWSNYADSPIHPSYSPAALSSKKEIVAQFIQKSKVKTVWDIGGNTGDFSRIAALTADLVVSMDFDRTVVEKNYLTVKKNAETRILPIVSDITNPAPGVGWNNSEREGLLERSKPDLVLALALIHHLAIASNIPLSEIRDILHSLSPLLIIEFIPKADKQVQDMFAVRDDIFPDYTHESFEKIFSVSFRITKKATIADSKRTLYLLTAK